MQIVSALELVKQNKRAYLWDINAYLQWLDL